MILSLLEKMPPRFALEGYWTVLKMLKSINQENLGTEMDKDKQEIMYLYTQELINLNYPEESLSILIYDILNIMDEIQKTKQHHIDLQQIYQIISKSIRKSNSERRMVAWALYRLYTKGREKIEIEDILQEISYPEEFYETLFREVSNIRMISDSKTFLLKGPYERLGEVVKNKDIHSIDVIEEIRRMEREEIKKVLAKFGLKEHTKFSKEILGAIKHVLWECYGSIWPYFGVLIVNHHSYFKLFRGQSNKAYVDVPHDVIMALQDILGESRSKSEFYQKFEEYLKWLNSSLDMSWLAFSLASHKLMKKYGLKVKINWPQFVSFIEDFSYSKDKTVWEKYEYIWKCRWPALKIILSNPENKREYLRERVKEICSRDLEEISSSIENIKESLESLREMLLRFYRKYRYKEENVPSLSTLAYLPEGITLMNTIESLLNEGLFPSCYRELRKFLENLSWTVFGDYLVLETYRRYGVANDKVNDNYALIVSKKWYEKKREVDISHFKGIIKSLHEELSKSWNLPGKNKLLDEVLSILTFPSYVLLGGEFVEKQSEEIPTYRVNDLEPYTLKDFELLGQKIKASTPEKFARDMLQSLKRQEYKEYIIPPYPSNNMVIISIEKWFNIKGLSKKYGDYSTFVHSYPQSWIIFPFSSVIEVKTFNKEIQDVEELVSRQIFHAYKALLSKVTIG